MGMAQWAAASTGVEGLKAISVAQASADFYRAHWYSPGGAMSLDCSLNRVSLIVFNTLRRRLAAGDTTVTADLNEVAGLLAGASALTPTLPISNHPVLIKHAPWFRDVLEHPSRDEYWTAYSPLESFEKITVPALSIAGWYDTFLTETLRAYREARARGGNARRRPHDRATAIPRSVGQRREGRPRRHGSGAHLRHGR
jgi:uncharacterized protein